MILHQIELERGFQSELQLPWIEGASGLTKGSDRRHSASCLGVDAVVDPPRQLEVCPVQHVEALRTELQACFFAEPEGLEQRNIGVEKVGTDKLVAPLISIANGGIRDATTARLLEEAARARSTQCVG